MNPRFSTVRALGCTSLAILLGACANLKVTHVPPKQSLNVALAKKAELVRLPQEPTAVAGAHVPAVEPELPGSSLVERVAEAYSRGEFCMSTGKDDEAIAAFEDTVKIDPAFTEGWQHLAMLYEKKGDTKKAIEAFRRSKKIARQ
jgi:predicted Zn-dependent protease